MLSILLAISLVNLLWMYRELNRECLPLAYQETYQRGSLSWEILLFYECDSSYVIMLSKILVDVPNHDSDTKAKFLTSEIVIQRNRFLGFGKTQTQTKKFR